MKGRQEYVRVSRVMAFVLWVLSWGRYPFSAKKRWGWYRNQLLRRVKAGSQATLILLPEKPAPSVKRDWRISRVRKWFVTPQMIQDRLDRAAAKRVRKGKKRLADWWYTAEGVGLARMRFASLVSHANAGRNGVGACAIRRGDVCRMT